MAYRAIHDSVAVSESLSGLSDGAERLFWRIVAVSDNHGRLPGRATKIKALCVPLVDCTVEQVQGWMRELRDVERIVIYEANDDWFLQLVNFDQYQSNELIRKRGRSSYPAPPGIEDAERAEREYEAAIERDLLDGVLLVDGERATSVRRQHRVGNSYIDLLVGTPLGFYVFELKAKTVSNAAVSQAKRYADALGGGAKIVVAGSAVGVIDDPTATAGVIRDGRIEVVRGDVALCYLTNDDVNERQSVGVLEEKRVEENLAADAARTPIERLGKETLRRPRDIVWDWLDDRFGRVAPRTNAHGKRNKACADLKRLGVTTAEQLDAAFNEYPNVFHGARCPTDQALATHYPRLAVGQNAGDIRRTAQSWFDNVGCHLEPDAFEEELADLIVQGLDEQSANDLRARHQETAGV